MPRNPTQPELITPAVAAKRLGMNPTTMKEAIIDKRLPFGNAWRSKKGEIICKIPKEQFEKYMRGELLDINALACALREELTPFYSSDGDEIVTRFTDTEQEVLL